MAYLEAFQITGKRTYKTAVHGILDYLLAALFSPDAGLFFASQDADEPFYQGSWKDRDATTPPPVDRTFYAGWNALAAHALIVAGDVLGVRAQSRLGSEILERLWQHSWVPTQGLCRRVGSPSDAAVILSDQVNFLRAWLALYQSTCRPDYLTRAVEVADTVQQLFGAPDGGCYDTTVPRSFRSRAPSP